MNRKGHALSPSNGYVLIEVLVASVLLSLAGTGLYAGLMEGIRTERVIRDTSRIYDPLRIFWKRLEKDLRNSVYLGGESYTGKQDEMVFPMVQTTQENEKEYVELRRIHYFVKGGVLKRSDQKLSNRLVKEDPNERVVLKGFDGIRFQYAYLDEEEKLLFRPFWLEEPYFGIPRAVRVEVTLQGLTFSKLISIPQGRWGRVQAGED